MDTAVGFQLHSEGSDHAQSVHCQVTEPQEQELRLDWEDGGRKEQCWQRHFCSKYPPCSTQAEDLSTIYLHRVLRSVFSQVVGMGVT